MQKKQQWHGAEIRVNSCSGDFCSTLAYKAQHESIEPWEEDSRENAVSSGSRAGPLQPAGRGL